VVAALDVEEAGMANEAQVSVIGFVATQPIGGYTKTGSRSVSMRVGWTPRVFDRDTGAWTDQASSFLTVQCYRKVAEHAAVCLRRGDPIVVRGSLRVREYVDKNGVRRSSVEVTADSIGHDMSRGISWFTRSTAQAERTAAEYEQAMAPERHPLPGDRDAAAAEQDAAASPGTASGSAGLDAAAGPDVADEAAEPEPGEDEAAAAEPADEPASDFSTGGSFDDAVRQMIADPEEAVPVGTSG
jgi:single-strand DNA-binding protein